MSYSRLTPAEAGRLVFPISRLICDVERFASDDDEPMAKRGMGAIYTQTSRDEMLRVPPDAAHREALLNRWYWPHHVLLDRVVNDVIERSGICLIVDCHSFSSVALPLELDQTSDRADTCVGTDPFHTPSSIGDAIAAAAKAEGYSVAVDAPFAGALVPLSFYRKDPRVLSVMIEVNRRRYMDENSGAKKQSFEDVRSTVGRLIVSAAQAARKR